MGGNISGARDLNNFYLNIQNGYGVKESSITYEGILNAYNYGIPEELLHLFNISYSSAITKGPKGNLEHYLCFEMKSKYDGTGLARNGGRPSMNFSFALDISGSMSVSFSGEKSGTKLHVAKECLINLLSKLQPNDKFGLILFDDKAEVLIPLDYVKNIDLSDAKAKILEVATRGGTSIMEGMNAAEKILAEDKDKTNETNRIFFLTDMNPSDDCDIVELGHTLSKKSIYISIIGIGVDFNSDLMHKFSQIKGCNSFGVMSAAEFRKQMDEDFDYTSMLICYDVSVKLQSNKFEVEEIYGSPLEPNKEIGEVLKLDSICPSPISSDGTGIKGGIAVLKLKRKQSDDTKGEELHLSTTYKDWDNENHQQDHVYQFPDDPTDGEYFQSDSAKKATALIREENQKEDNIRKLEDVKNFLLEQMEILNDVSIEKEIEAISGLLKNLQKVAEN